VQGDFWGCLGCVLCQQGLKVELKSGRVQAPAHHYSPPCLAYLLLSLSVSSIFEVRSGDDLSGFRDKTTITTDATTAATDTTTAPTAGAVAATV
jgi:hypothetical protein